MEDYFMLREFVQLVDEAVDEGFDRGLTMFMESLEEDLMKAELISENGSTDKIIAEMLVRDGIVGEETLNEDIDESTVDALLAEFKKKGM
jgi:hypothetical protein